SSCESSSTSVFLRRQWEQNGLRIPLGMQEVSQGQAKRSPWKAGGQGAPRPEGARDRSRLTNVSGLASFQDAVLFCAQFQGLRFACLWLPSRIPNGMPREGSNDLNSFTSPTRRGIDRGPGCSDLPAAV